MKRLTAILLIAGLFLYSSAPFVFADGDQSYVAQDNNYVPRDENYATREETVAGFVKAIGAETEENVYAVLSQFSDAGKIASVYQDEIAIAVEEGLVSGYDDGSFRPQNTITRIEALVILNRALSKRTLPALYDVSFEDTPAWAAGDIHRLGAAGIVKGYGDGTLGAEDLLTTEQVKLLTERAARMMGPAGDFYEYINEDWMEETQIPAGKPFWSNIDQISQSLYKEIGDIIYTLYRQRYKEQIEFEKGTSEQKIADVFSAASNTVYRDLLGLEPAQEYLSKIDDVQDMDDLLETMAYLEYNGFHGLLPLAVSVDVYDSSKYVLTFSSCYTGMNTALVQGEDKEKVTNAYREYLAALFSLFGQEETAESVAAEVADLCTQLAEKAMPLAEHNAVKSHYQFYSDQELNEIFSNIDMGKFMEILKLSGAGGMVVYDLPLAEEINKIFVQENIELLKNYLRASVMDGSALYLNSEAFFVWRDYQDALNGTKSDAIAADYAVNMVEELLGWDLAKLYVEKYASPTAKAEVEAMTETILNAYVARLEKNTWLSDETRKKAISKIQNIQIRVGYPEDIAEYPDPGYEITSIKNGGNLMTYRTGYCRRYFDTCEGIFDVDVSVVDQTVWSMLPQTVNAMYDPSSNSITIPSGILHAPFYDPKASYESNLGGIGTVIAHEISHALDSLGSQFDEKGNLQNWWQEEDKKAFDAICKQVIEAYGQIEALPGVYVNGTQTLGENLADLAGMACVLDIAGKDNPRLNDLFTTYAETWRLVSTELYAKIMLQQDTHAPDKIRVNRVLSNFDIFEEYYDIHEGDGMYLPEDQRIQIWRSMPTAP